MDLAVAAARRAFDDGPWRKMSGAVRAELKVLGFMTRGFLKALKTGKREPCELWNPRGARMHLRFFALPILGFSCVLAKV